MLQECSDGIAPQDLFGAKMQKYDDEYHHQMTMLTMTMTMAIMTLMTMMIYDFATYHESKGVQRKRNITFELRFTLAVRFLRHKIEKLLFLKS